MDQYLHTNELNYQLNNYDYVIITNQQFLVIFLLFHHFIYFSPFSWLYDIDFLRNSQFLYFSLSLKFQTIFFPFLKLVAKVLILLLLSMVLYYNNRLFSYFDIYGSSLLIHLSLHYFPYRTICVLHLSAISLAISLHLLCFPYF